MPIFLYIINSTKPNGVYILKKNISIVLACILVFSACFAACSSKDDSETDNTTTAPEGLAAADNEYGFETDEDGNTVAVVYEKDKNGNTVAYVVDNNGNKTGKTVKVDDKKQQSSGSGSGNNSGGSNPQKGPEDITNPTDDEKETTSPELTTLQSKDDIVPSTTDKGTPVKFSDEDIAKLTNLLEVPYLYSESFENSQKLPISVASHVACWMAQREGINNSTFASGTIVLDLFKYYAQTIVDYKTLCNKYSNVDNAAPITYNSTSDTFTISSFENPTHSIQITKVEFLGNNNYYKVTADVKAIDNKSCNYKKVVAVIQKNKLDTELGFSIKALQWS